MEGRHDSQHVEGEPSHESGWEESHTHTPSQCIPSFPEGSPVLPTGVQTVRRIPWPSWDPPFMSLSHSCPMLFGGSFGHPGILPWCPLRHRPPSCPEDPLDIPGLPTNPVQNSSPNYVVRPPPSSHIIKLCKPSRWHQTSVEAVSVSSDFSTKRK